MTHSAAPKALFTKLAVLLPVVLLMACGSEDKSMRFQAQAQLSRQLALTCAQGGEYRKEVVRPVAEVKTFSLADTCFLDAELEKLLEICWQDPKLDGVLIREQRGDTLVFMPDPNGGSALTLSRQEVVQQGDIIRYLRTITYSKNWLYEQKVDIAAEFDEEGLYQRHTLFISARQPWSKANFEGTIYGSRP